MATGSFSDSKRELYIIQTDLYVLIAEIEGSDEIKSWFPFGKQIVWYTHLV